MEIDWLRLLLMLSPVFLFQLALSVYALVDLRRRTRVRGSRMLWAVLLVVTTFTLPTGIIVSALYLAWGRHAEESDDQN